MPKIPDSTKASLYQGLIERSRQRWPQLREIRIRYRAGFAYIDGVLADGEVLRLCRLRYGGSARDWGFTMYRTMREAISPYGYAGIHVADDMTTAEAADAWTSARACLKELGVASLFLRFNPLDTSSKTAAEGFDDLTVERIRTTCLVNIVREHMWDRLWSSCRSRIRTARKNGYTGQVRPAGAADVAPGSAFRRLYEQTMQRRSATPQYYFSDDYYVELLAGLGSDLLLCEVRDHDAEVVSSCLLMRHAGFLHYHLAGSDPDGAVMGSNNLVMWTAAELAFGQGLGRLHLGGGRAESDGLARFKSTFGAGTRDLHVGRAIIDSEAYSRLTRARADQLDTTFDAPENADYFPAFRASVG